MKRKFAHHNKFKFVQAAVLVLVRQLPDRAECVDGQFRVFQQPDDFVPGQDAVVGLERVEQRLILLPFLGFDGPICGGDRNHLWYWRRLHLRHVAAPRCICFHPQVLHVDVLAELRQRNELQSDEESGLVEEAFAVGVG